MRMSWARLLFIFLIGFGAFHYLTQREIEYVSGELVFSITTEYMC
jgi:hypothetical protein